MRRTSVGKFDKFINVVCTLLFALFAFVYVYEYQADSLTVMQHVFSKGQTHYNAFVGAIIITAVLLLLQIGVARLCRRMSVAVSFTFVPSALALILLTSFHFTVDGQWFTNGRAVMVVVMLVLYGVLMVASSATHLSEYMAECLTLPLRKLWINVGVMSMLMIMTCLLGNGDRRYHSRIHMEQCLLTCDFSGALKVAKQYDKPDSCLTMLLAYTLSRQGAMGDKLFEHRLMGKSSALLPNGKNVGFSLLAEDKFYQYLGANFLQKMSPRRYFDFLERHKMLNKVSADYLLCACLLDKDLNAFAGYIAKFYAIDGKLPKHYKEALVLYAHQHSAPRIVYGNSVMEADYQDFLNMGNSYADVRERKNMLRGTYGNTYWFYYEYE